MLKPLFIYLQEKPWIGMVSGAGSGILASVHKYLTDETFTQTIGALSMCGGLIVVILTICAKAIELRHKLKNK